MYMFGNKGFTLVELAIVMTIIGLLVGGVLKGQEMIKNARISQTISQVNSQRAAVITFRDTYSNYPGDFPLATTRLLNCTASTLCYNGDGNGKIGQVITSWASDPYDDSPIITENTQFWKHLANANLLSGIVPNTATIAWGESHPAGAFNGGYRIVDTDIVGHFSGGGTILSRLVGPVSGPVRMGPGLNPVTPTVAQAIDMKMDDGVANTGYVKASSGAGSGGCRENGDPGGLDGFYNPTINSADCIMAFGVF